MKSFGVRLAAGALTILTGACAAALAQKDKQSDGESWTAAQPPSLGEPIAPISGIEDDSWLSQPVSDTATSPDAGPSTPPTFANADPASIQLVQHSELIDSSDAPTAPSASSAAFDPTSIPESLGPAGTDDEAPPSDSWLLPPPEAGQSDSSAGRSSQFDTGPALSMTLPDEASSEPSPPVAGANGPSELPAFQFSEVPLTDSGVQEDSTANAAGAASISSSPRIVGAEAAVDGSAGESSTPQNALRSADSGVNGLRDAAGAGAAAVGAGAAIATSSAGATSVLDTSPMSANSNEAASNPTSAVQQLTIPGQQLQIASEPALVGDFSTAQAVASPNQSTPRIVPPQADAIAMETASGAPNQRSAIQLQPQPMEYGNDSSQSFAANPAQQSQATLRNPPVPLNQPNDALALRQDAAIDAPGDRRLEGMQTPSIVIQKRAPNEVKVGKQATFVIHVQNVGAVEALDVTVHDKIPAGMSLVDATPAPIQNGNLLVWQLGSMPAGDEQTVTLQLVPEQEGELGSVARVSFEAAASVRTIATRPELQIVQRAPETVLIGQQLEIELEVSNPGTGEATGVMLQEDVPEGLEHPKGRQLDNAMGSLRPGEVRHQVLRLRAVEPGIVNNTIRLSGDDGLAAEHTVTVQVVAPDLQIELEGPTRRFLERQAKYELNVANSGTADATNIEIAVQLDRGFNFVSTDFEGQYDPSRHTVYWSLAQLPAGASGKVPLVLLPVEEGEQAIRIDARADLGVSAESERRMTVEGFAELQFSITNPSGPIELGAETLYQIQVSNSGSKADGNVQVALELPPGLELLSANGSGEAGTDGQGLVRFQPAAQLSPGNELSYTVRVRGVAAGTHVVRAIVVSDQGSVPVTKEESTLVYSDQ